MENKSFKILFIGNSYTYVNNLPAIFGEIAKEAGYNLHIAAVTNGGWTLEKHATVADVYGAAVDAVLKGEKFDYVILQEQSLRPSVNTEPFFKAVRDLMEKIKLNGATAFLYGTWGRKEGSAALEEHSMTQEEMTYKTAASYAKAANEHNINVAQTGFAYWDVCKNHPEIELFATDKSHPSKSGSFLSALTIYAKLFGKDPREIKYTMNLEESEANILKTAAFDAVYNAPEIPENYKN